MLFNHVQHVSEELKKEINRAELPKILLII